LKPEWEQAVYKGDVDHIRRLLREGADINARDRYGQTALMIAARNGSATLVRYLVDQGAELDQSAKYHLTALMLAVLNGSLEIARTLVTAGANLEIQGTGAPGFHGKTALDLARAQNRPDLVDALRQSE
jgi:ankyrin repeat protein